MLRPKSFLNRKSSKAQIKKFFFVVFLIALPLVLPPLFLQSTRSGSIYFFSKIFKPKSNRLQHSEKKLETENHLLRSELKRLQTAIAGMVPICTSMPDTECLPATVIYRDPMSWSSSLWINVGEEDNKKSNATVIAKNSPVVLGKSLVGAIDYVGKKQSRVRLITDSGLNPSVRAVRGKLQNELSLEHLDALLRILPTHSEVFLSLEEKENALKQLEAVRQRFLNKENDLYLAKGIIQGSGAPLWRSPNQVLKGIGFNYDYADADGPARDLATGKPSDPKNKEEPVVLIQKGDLLITTGLDGVFPPGLRVGIVTKVYPLKEGSYTYTLEATPAVNISNEMQNLFVLSPKGGRETFTIKD